MKSQFPTEIGRQKEQSLLCQQITPADCQSRRRFINASLFLNFKFLPSSSLFFFGSR